MRCLGTGETSGQSLHNEILLIILAVIATLFFAMMMRAVLKIMRARRAVREHHYKMLRDGFICVKCGYNVRACKDQCSECGWPIGDDPE